MVRIKARYRKGVFEPVEPVELPEETEVEVTVSSGFFALLDKMQANIEASGVSDEEWEKLVEEVSQEARKRTGERYRQAAGGGA